MLTYTNTDPVAENLTGPGGLFEMEQCTHRDRDVRVFKDFPHTIAELMRTAAQRQDADFVIDRGKTYKVGHVLGEAAALGRILTESFAVSKGTRVAVVMSNRVEWIIAFFGIAALGAIPVLVNSRGSGEELRYAVETFNCSVVFADAERAALLRQASPDSAWRLIALEAEHANLRPGLDLDWAQAIRTAEPPALRIVETEPGDHAAVMFTSGTTGFPKGALHTQLSVTHAVGMARLMGHLSDLQFEREFCTPIEQGRGSNSSPTIIGGPLFHVGGVTPMLRCFYSGIPLVLLPKWQPELVLEIIERHGISRIAFGPTMYWDLLRSPKANEDNIGGIRFVASGTAPIAPGLSQELRKRMPKMLLSNTYGSTEIMGYGASLGGAELVDNPTSCGYVVPGAKVRLVTEYGTDAPVGEEGEVCVCSAAVMDCYIDQPDETEATLVNGWLYTGDTARIDEAGRLHIVGRKKQMIISGGENIYAAEIERIMSDMPGVLEVMAFGVPDDRLGERLAVALVTEQGADLTGDGVKDFARQHLGSYKIPREVLFWDAPFPRTATGKPDRTSVIPALVAALQ